MNNRISFNLRILPAENTFISAISSAALYGKGVFTSVAIYNAKPFLWEKHWRRLQDAAEKIGLDLSDYKETRVRTALKEILFLNNLKKGRARLTLFDESAGKIWGFDSKNKTSLLITTGEFQPAKDDLRLTVSPFAIYSKSPLAGVKSCNYLENLLALEEARKRGFDEAVRLNEKGEIAAAAMGNVFWTRGEKIFTPPPATGCRAGTTREFLLENFTVEEKTAKLTEFRRADEIFLTSAGIGVKSAESLDKKPLGRELAGKIQNFFEDAVKT